MDTTELVRAAAEAREKSYSPYSNFSVGAALLACGRVFKGTNVENSSFGLSMCAERVAIFNAVSEGCRDIEAIAIYAERMPYPCGACLQVMAEFCSPDCKVIVATSNSIEEYTLGELLPKSFSLKD